MDQVGIEELVVGVRLLNARKTCEGTITSVVYDGVYKKDDKEKNPVFTIEWDNGNTSYTTLPFMDNLTFIR